MNKRHDSITKKIIKTLAILSVGYIIFDPFIALTGILFKSANVVYPIHIFFPLLLGLIIYLIIKDVFTGKIVYAILAIVFWLFLKSTTYSVLFMK